LIGSEPQTLSERASRAAVMLFKRTSERQNTPISSDGTSALTTTAARFQRRPTSLPLTREK